METEARAENEAREENEVPDLINLPNLSMRGLFAEYPELVTSGDAGRMWDWGWRATMFCRQMNIEHKVFALLMLDSHSDSTIPLDDAIVSFIYKKYHN